MSKQEILSIFQEAVEKPINPRLQEWVSGGGKVVGYYCSLIPGEIFTAAGIVPYRIRGAGSESTDLADVYVSAQVCTFLRHTLNLALDGQFDFLSGIVAMNGCDQSRRAFDIWKNKTQIPFQTVISVPRAPEEYNFDWYKEELAGLIAGIEKQFSVKITPESLAEAIRLHNTVRRKLHQFNDLRKGTSINGYDATTVTIAAQVMPLRDFNDLLGTLLEALQPVKQDSRPYRARLVISGGEMDEPEFVKVIEEQGGMVVYEDTCFGARYYEEPVEEGGDPLSKIAERYFYRMPCARMANSFDKRYESLKTVCKEYKAEGIIAQYIVHCLLNAGEAWLINMRAKAGETPALILDRECGMRGYGQIKTRVQAFIESIEAKSGKGGE